MAYNKTIWQDLPNETTPINAEHLNKIENELEALDTGKADKTVATTSANGLMSASDKGKFNEIDLGTSPADLNNIDGNRTAYCLAVANSPVSNFYGFVIQMQRDNGSVKKQFAVSYNGMKFYTRSFVSESWSSWAELVNDEYSTSEKRVGTWVDRKTNL